MKLLLSLLILSNFVLPLVAVSVVVLPGRTGAGRAGILLSDFDLNLLQAAVEVTLELGGEFLVGDAGFAVDAEVLVEVVVAGEVA